MISFSQRLFNFSKDALIVVLGWPAGLKCIIHLWRTHFVAEFKLHWPNNFTGNQLFLSKMFCLLWALLFKFRQNPIHLLLSICNFDFINLLFKSWGTKLNNCNQNKAVSETYNEVCKDVGIRTCFFIYKSESTIY